MPAPLLLHVFPSFETGGAQTRTVTLMNALGGRFRHAVVAINGDLSCGERIEPGVDWRAVAAPGSRNPLAAARAFRGMIGELGPDLLVTYNWGAIDALLALLPGRLCPAIHVEDGFGPDEAQGLKRRRVWTRRALLPRTVHCLAVPSRTLWRIAREQYRLAESRIRLIANGVDIERFRPRRDSALRDSLGIPEDAVVFGTVGRLRPEKDLPWLVRRFAEAKAPNTRLVLVGAGPAEADIRAAVQAAGVSDSVHFTGEAADPAPFYGVFDVFAMSSLTEQMPMGLLEAMSSGLPALCTGVGDIAELLPPSQRRLAVPRAEPGTYVRELQRLAGDPALRVALGRENRARAEAEFSLARMVERWHRLYLEAAGMPPPPEQQHEYVP
jgi:L-malate glycosyltransferase